MQGHFARNGRVGEFEAGMWQIKFGCASSPLDEARCLAYRYHSRATPRTVPGAPDWLELRKVSHRLVWPTEPILPGRL
ncbi:hypothetical protein BAE40_29660 [Mesorhizobium loti]|nr:hypothetical protein BAE40_29660 [Mesorhizobium loti]